MTAVYLYVGVGEPCAGHTKAKVAKALLDIVNVLVSSENLGLVPPIGST